MVFFSIITIPDSPGYERVRQRENLAPEDVPQDQGSIYRAMGSKGLESTENAGLGTAEVVEGLLQELTAKAFCGILHAICWGRYSLGVPTRGDGR